MGRWRRAWAAAGAVLVLAGAGCGTGQAGAPVRLEAGPAAAALVVPVNVSVSGLPPTALVTIQARTLDAHGQPWVSAAVFRASAAGTLNLATAVPVSGSYHTADAGGLLWSLHPAGSSQLSGFITPRAGFAVRLEVLTGGRVAATATLQRRWQEMVSVQTVRRDGFAGLLYTSAAIRPGAPAVVVLGGAEGGYDAVVAAGLAMAGYPALALAYFDEPGLPQCLCSIPLEYFARAVSWLRAQPAGRGRPLILYGASRGAEAVLLLASYLPHLADGVVASSPTAIVNPADGNAQPGPAWTFGGKPLVPLATIPVTRIRVPLLMGDGGQDAVLGLRRGGQHHCRRAARLPRPRAGHQPVLPRRRALLLRPPSLLPVLRNYRGGRAGRQRASRRPGHRAVLDQHDHLPSPLRSHRAGVRTSAARGGCRATTPGSPCR